MKKMRKTLSLLLVLALVLGSFSMVFGAGTTMPEIPVLTDINDLLGRDQIQVCQALGIIEGMPDRTFQPDTLVNRAQFAAMVTRALGIPESALVGYEQTGTRFTDLDGYNWARKYLAYCDEYGIMLGDGQGHAMPGKTITANEAVTMLLRAVGYKDANRELIGRWPANYITLGKSWGIYENLSEDAKMTRENSAIALYNALMVPRVYGTDYEGRTVFREIPDPDYPTRTIRANLLNSALGCNFKIDAMIIPDDFGRSLINVADRLGAFGTKYILRNNNILIAFKANDDTALLTGTLGDPGKFEAEDGKVYSFANMGSMFSSEPNIYYDADGVRHTEYTDIINYKGWFLNGEYATTPFGPAGGAINKEVVSTSPGAYDAGNWYDNIDEFTKGNRNIEGGKVTLSVKISGLSINKAYGVVGWTTTEDMVVTPEEVKAITDNKELLGGKFPLDDNGNIDTRQFSLVGADRLSDIQEDDVVYVYTYKPSATERVIRKVAVGKDVVEGAIDKANYDDFGLDGKIYDYAINYLYWPKNGGQGGNALGNATPADNVIDAVGEEATVRLDAYGNGYDIDTTGGIRRYGVITSVAAIGVRGNEVWMFDSEDGASARILTRVGGNRFTLYGERDYRVDSTGVNRSERLSEVRFLSANISSDSVARGLILGDGTHRPFIPTGDEDGGLLDTQATFKNSGKDEYARLYGYGLDTAGNVSSLQIASGGTATSANSLGLKGTTVLNVTNASGNFDIPIDPKAVVFAYKKDSEGNIDIAAKGVSAIDTVELWKAKQLSNAGVNNMNGYHFQYILSRDGRKVAALMLHADYVGGDDNSVYGMIQSYTNIRSGSRNELEIVALVDGESKIYRTDRMARDLNDVKSDLEMVMSHGVTHGAILSPVKLTLNTDGNVKALNVTLFEDDDTNGVTQFRVRYYYGLTNGGISGNIPVGDLQARQDGRPGNVSNSRIDLVGLARRVEVSSNVVVYQAKWTDAGGGKFEYLPSSLSSIERAAGIFAYDTKGSDVKGTDGRATIVIWLDYSDRGKNSSDDVYDDISNPSGTLWDILPN